MYKRTVLTMFVLVAGLSCDLEKFTGYQYEVDPLPESASISGQIRNRFTGEAVNDALIRFGDQETTSDSTGYYYLDYRFSEDELRNKPVPVYIEADDYLAMTTEKIVFPKNSLNFQLDYGAPIIKRAVIKDYICQAEVFDYQGSEEIIYAQASFFYAPPGVPMWELNLQPEMLRVPIDSPHTAYFQVQVKEFDPLQLVLSPSFIIFAWDSLGFSDKKSNTIVGVDTFLFDPDLLPLPPQENQDISEKGLLDQF
jgi:hypothetical protein